MPPALGSPLAPTVIQLVAFSLPLLDTGIGEIIGCINVLGIVTSCMYQQYTLAVGIFYGLINPFLLWREVFTKAHVDDPSAIVYRITDSQGNIFIMLIAIGYRPDHHDAHIIRHTIHTLAIVAHGADDTGYVCAMERRGGHYIRIAIVFIIDIVFIITYHVLYGSWGHFVFRLCFSFFATHELIEVSNEVFIGFGPYAGWRGRDRAGFRGPLWLRV